MAWFTAREAAWALNSRMFGWRVANQKDMGLPAAP